jgi:hypothetical protein
MSCEELYQGVWDTDPNGSTKTRRNANAELSMRFVPHDLVEHWRRCGLTADFLAHFLAYNFTVRETALNVISTVLNELLENAVKFSADKARMISLVLVHYGDTVCIETKNFTDAACAASFQTFLARLTTEDAEELFRQQIEYAMTSDQASSGLGLITLKKDHQAQIHVRIEQCRDTGFFETVVRVTLDAEELDRS